jgi:hypothetical protein
MRRLPVDSGRGGYGQSMSPGAGVSAGEAAAVVTLTPEVLAEPAATATLVTTAGENGDKQR